MILCIYSVFDLQGLAFGTPFFFHTNGMALRAFTDLANDKQTTVGQHPQDFRLVRVGAFDVQTGNVTHCDHEQLGLAADFVRPSEPRLPSFPHKV